MLSIVIPCFNEERMIALFYDKTQEVLKSLNTDVEFVFVDDGSSDQTLDELQKLEELDPRVQYLSFSRNFGKEAALLAGLREAKGEFVCVMDVDLQDPPELLLQMYHDLQVDSQLDCVGTRRVTRKGEPVMRSLFACVFYRLMNQISETKIVDGARDFRLMRRQMVDAILELSEYNRFSKGIFSWVGFQTKYLPYENQERVAGETSWSFRQLLNYSIDGIVNYSDFPLKLASFIGALSCIAAFLGFVFIVIRALLFGDRTPGWPSVVSIMLFMGGIQLLCLGILGQYIGKIFMETKKRPHYIIKYRSKR